MASYSEFDGVPIHVSRAVLTDMLRGRMGFTGTVVSDYNGVGPSRRFACRPRDDPERPFAAHFDFGRWRHLPSHG
jgi:beta-glucosidase